MRSIRVGLSDEVLALLDLLASPGDSVEDTVARLIAESSLSHLLRLLPDEFEMLVGRALEARGYDVEYLGGRGDEGIDLLAKRGQEVLAVQCKRYRDSPVTPNQIREFLGAMVASTATRGVFVTTSFYTDAARVLAAAQRIEIVDAAGLHAWLIESGSGGNVKRCVKCGAVAISAKASTQAWICTTCNQFNSVPKGHK